MKRFLLALMMVGLFAGVAHASNFTAYMTDSSLAALPDNYTYSLSQDPWLAFNVPTSGLKMEWAKWFNNASQLIFSSSWTTMNQTYVEKPAWTQALKTPGEWLVTLKATSGCPDGICEKKTLHFNFAPEPVSCSLFLLGGAGLAFARRKNKTKV